MEWDRQLVNLVDRLVQAAMWEQWKNRVVMPREQAGIRYHQVISHLAPFLETENAKEVLIYKQTWRWRYGHHCGSHVLVHEHQKRHVLRRGHHWRYDAFVQLFVISALPRQRLPYLQSGCVGLTMDHVILAALGPSSEWSAKLDDAPNIAILRPFSYEARTHSMRNRLLERLGRDAFMPTRYIRSWNAAI